jgi:catechol 2,3-dioxygenase-like lactoylglutathione lyase family enzyme
MIARVLEQGLLWSLFREVSMSTATPLFLKIDALSLPVTDLEQALAFYRAQLGHELIWRTDGAAGLRLPDSTTELVLRTDDRPAETDILVASAREAAERFCQAGGEIVAGEQRLPVRIACGCAGQPVRGL